MGTIEEYESLKTELIKFQSKLQSYNVSKKEEIETSKKNYLSNLRMLKNEEIELLRNIEDLNNKQQQIQLDYKADSGKLATNENMINNLKIQQQNFINEKSTLEEDNNFLQQKIDELNDIIDKTRDELILNGRTDVEEVIKYQKYLGLSVQRLSDGILRFIFINIDSNDLDREFFIDIQIDEVCRIVNSEPRIDMAYVEDPLTSNDAFKKILKTARQLFKDTLA
ncbi:probable kinetochore protein Spc25p [[Candida] jaroonii]|uniref:Probable kinetochore protein Spc25p n=1 Tax=[Candida] jaroonii TaxID=467808 RepID=A0ACA9Y8P7_9ASCO|nr:probable kinetochore protein Spc25p [[Candida] jaroonii]